MWRWAPFSVLIPHAKRIWNAYWNNYGNMHIYTILYIYIITTTIITVTTDLPTPSWQEIARWNVITCKTHKQYFDTKIAKKSTANRVNTMHQCKNAISEELIFFLKSALPSNFQRSLDKCDGTISWNERNRCHRLCSQDWRRALNVCMACPEPKTYSHLMKV